MRLIATIAAVLIFACSGQAIAYVYNGDFTDTEWSSGVFGSNTVSVSPHKVTQNQLFMGSSSAYSLDVTKVVTGGVIGQFDVQVDFAIENGFIVNNYERIGLGVENKGKFYSFAERVSQWGYSSSSESYLTDTNGVVAGGTPAPSNYFTNGTLKWTRGSDNYLKAYFFNEDVSQFQQIGSSILFSDPLTNIHLSIWSIAGSSPVNMQVAFDDFKLSTPTAATPEPGTMLLMGIGAAGVAFMRRRKMKAN